MPLFTGGVFKDVFSFPELCSIRGDVKVWCRKRWRISKLWFWIVHFGFSRIDIFSFVNDLCCTVLAVWASEDRQHGSHNMTYQNKWSEARMGEDKHVALFFYPRFSSQLNSKFFLWLRFRHCGVTLTAEVSILSSFLLSLQCDHSLLLHVCIRKLRYCFQTSIFSHFSQHLVQQWLKQL